MVGCLMVTQSSKCQSPFYMSNVNVSHLHIKKKLDTVKSKATMTST